MSKPQVVEYFLNSENFIIGWQLYKEDKRPNLIGIQMPTEEMNNSLTDVYGKYIYQLSGNLVIEIIKTPTAKEEAYAYLMKLPKDTIVKAIINGVETGWKGTGYESLKALVIAANGDLNEPV